MKSFHRHISDGFRMFCKVPVDSVKQMLKETADLQPTAAKEMASVCATGVRRSRTLSRCTLALAYDFHPRAGAILLLL